MSLPLRPCLGRALGQTGRPAIGRRRLTSASGAASQMMRDFAGQSISRRQVLDGNQLQRLSLTLNRRSLHPELDVAIEAPPPGTPIPPGYHLVYFTPTGVESELGPDGTDSTFNAPSPFTRRMWAGGRMKWTKDCPLLVGQEAEERTRLLNAVAKRSRDGSEMVLVEVEKQFWNEKGLALVDQRSWIFRPESVVAAAASEAPLRDAVVAGPSTIEDVKTSDESYPVRLLRWSPVGLFRFSALTFNGHKIHYDPTQGILHKTEIVKQYTRFWEEPSAVSVSWLGLLFSILCLATQFHPSGLVIPNNSTCPTEYSIQYYREKVVQSLVLAQYSKGGLFVVETLIHYLAIEQYLRRDTEIEVWLVLGVAVQSAIRMGYHRDPSHFRNISVYDGEMRRRVWAALYHLDATVSTQMGMPRVIKDSIVDTHEPHNLLDTDFDANTTSMPQPRPAGEMTPMLPYIASSRLMRVFGVVSDLVTNPRLPSYAEVTRIDAKLNEVNANMAKSRQFRPLSESIADPPQLIFLRIVLQLVYLKSQILLHQKFLAPSKASSRYGYSRKITVRAALQILRFQHLIDEERKPTGRLEAIKWMPSSLINHEFLGEQRALLLCAA
ncbi:Uu.00g083110.m01.CDS01 [Anthostomella pinea]|uniref:Uu.00g083110.m01.CDS01 n=1 Tax=Anthostomella pinea TaxID=933095 RepID=A0AAI8YJK3_9PEZI|nr:Uu.00g083110.m01.CDS01 [Anthostomella pinea]